MSPWGLSPPATQASGQEWKGRSACRPSRSASLAAVPRGGGRQLLTGAEVEADKEGRASRAMRGEGRGRRGPWFSWEGWGWCQRGSLRLDLEVEEGS